ncbi:MAG TPA: DUF58 domain-containing protein [Thermoanaerobaculia bacterium]|nr:DUF58 domain-containing protein [Thermoanaerobaculia bacterium]
MSTAATEVGSLRRRQALLWLLASSLLALLLWFYSAGFFLYAAVVTAAILGIGAFLPAASLLGLEMSRSLGSETVELGETVESRLVLRNNKKLPALWLFWREEIEPGLTAEGITCGFQTLTSEETIQSSCTLQGTRRGLFRVGPAVIETSDPLGLVRRFRVDPEVRFLTVLPRTVDIGPGWPLGHRPIHEVPRRRSLFEDPSRFLGVRDYRAGDSLRRIHWRATARSGRLQVKLYEPAVLEGVLLAVEMGKAAWPLAPDETGADPAVELAVTAAASIAAFVLANGQEVGLISNGGDAADRYPSGSSGSSGWTGGSFRRLEDALQETEARHGIPAFHPLEVEPGRGRWQHDRLRTALARLTLAPGLTLAELLVAEAPRLPRSLVVLAVTPDLGTGLGVALASLRSSGFEVGVVWIRKAGAEPVGASLPEGVPIYPVQDETDLERLGAQAL